MQGIGGMTSPCVSLPTGLTQWNKHPLIGMWGHWPRCQHSAVTSLMTYRRAVAALIIPRCGGCVGGRRYCAPAFVIVVTRHCGDPTPLWRGSRFTTEGARSQVATLVCRAWSRITLKSMLIRSQASCCAEGLCAVATIGGGRGVSDPQWWSIV